MQIKVMLKPSHHKDECQSISYNDQSNGEIELSFAK